MIQVDDKIVSLDVFEKHFACDLQQCKGICCVEGDSGAPLLDEEKNIIEKNIEFIKTNMSSEGKKQLKKQGATIVDFEGDLTTPLVDGKECIYVTKENGINKCAIEKTYNQKKIDFKKPISCHLYPIRIQKYADFEAVNYEKNSICQPACECGGKLQIPLFIFLKEALVRSYGITWYNDLLKLSKRLPF
tara:strand:- start:517 stop:1083 length:567 start_codon:yes stop_codon:yes gene_type:complete